MKKLNILFAGLAALGMSSCNDFLEVEAPSAFDDSYVFENTTEANRLLNGVYASLASNNTFGNAFFNTFDLNSDVEYYTNGTEPEMMTSTQKFYRQYQCTPDASDLLSTWTAAYQTIERASNFVAAAEKSDLYAAGDTTLLQLIGEAKCMRAMNYLELVIMMGDIPFDLHRTYDASSLIKPIVDRDEILTTLINDLRGIAPHMQFSAVNPAGVERCSKEFAWALIAKMALYRGGYSMRKGATPADNGVMKRADDYLDYYKIARTYCDSVITLGGHALNKDFYQVFIDECNFKVAQGDDPIFEIPFTMDVSGNVGYAHGPACSAAAGSTTYHKWGATGGNVRLNYFHRYTYASTDKRRDCIGLWSYTDAAVGATPTVLKGQNWYCNKWSKFWDYSARQGAESTGSTGINFPYMRYADVLLMYAEAENELNGPTNDAKAALKKVRDRAFRGAANYAEMVDAYVDAASTKEKFFDLIFNERAWEFAGEGMRWKDLVRWNLLTKVVYQQFFKYFGYATNDYSYDLNDEFNNFPRAVYFKVVANPNKGADSYKGGYPNNDFDVLQFFQYESVATGQMVDNLWEPLNFSDMYDEDKPSTAGANAWTNENWGAWEDNNTGTGNTGSRLGFVGYIYADKQGTIQANSRYAGLSDANFLDQNWDALPSVRYIMPLPEDAISRSEGQYKNYYGY